MKLLKILGRLPTSKLLAKLRTCKSCNNPMLSGILRSIWFLLKSSFFNEEKWEIYSRIVPNIRLLLRLRLTKDSHWEKWSGIRWLKRLSARLREERLGSWHIEGENSPERLRLWRSIVITDKGVLKHVISIQLQWWVSEVLDQEEIKWEVSLMEDLKVRRMSDSYIVDGLIMGMRKF